MEKFSCEDFPTECPACPHCLIENDTTPLMNLIISDSWDEFIEIVIPGTRSCASDVLDYFGNKVGIDYRDAWCQTPLMHATMNGDLEGVEKLLDAGADIHAVDVWGWDSLMHAAGVDNFSILKELLLLGSDSRHVSREGKTYLGIILERGARLDHVIKDIILKLEVCAKMASGLQVKGNLL